MTPSDNELHHKVGPMLPLMADAFRNHGWRVVRTELVRASGHYVLDEQLDAVVESINHASTNSR
jgi:hypothetical protein